MALLQLELDVDRLASERAEDGSVHVHGTIRTADGREQSFVGWVALLALLQDAVVQDDGAAARDQLYS